MAVYTGPNIMVQEPHHRKSMKEASYVLSGDKRFLFRQIPASLFMFFQKKLYFNRLPDDAAHVSHFGRQATHCLKLDTMHQVSVVLLNLLLIKRPVCPMQT
jgi:hypothetical protein